MKRLLAGGFHCVRIAFAVIFLTHMATFAVHAKQIGIDQATLKQKLTDIAIEKIFNGISTASEEQLKNATYFNDLVRDMAPLGVKLDETNFSEQALSIYNKYKKAVEEGQTPEKARENVKKLVKADVSAIIYASLDKGSQEVVDDLNGLYKDAESELKKILDLNKELEKNPDADYAKLLKEFGIKGEALERFEKLEGELRGVYEKYGDYYKAGSIIYSGMSGNAGDRLEAFFELGSEFGSKVPIIGKFIELYAKVAKEMIEATGRLNKLLDERNAGCVGGAYHGSTPVIIKRIENTRNVRFREQFPSISTSACPVDRTKAFWQDVYFNESNSDQIYFWTGDGYVMGRSGHGGVEAVKELRKWLRSNNHIDKAEDIQFIYEAYNVTPGFTKFQEEAKKHINKINERISSLFSPSCLSQNASYQSFVAERGGLQKIIDTSYGLLSGPYGGNWSYFRLYEKPALDIYIEERYIKKRGAFGIACKNAAEDLENIETVSIEGLVFLKDAEGQSHYHPGAEIEVSPMNYVVTECSQLISDRSHYSVYLFLEKGRSLSVDLKADDGINTAANASVNVSEGQQIYRVNLTIESKCKKGETLDKDGNCVPVCKDGEKLDENGRCVPIEDKCKDGEKRDADGNCVPVCPDGEKLDDNGNCVPICKPNEKLDADGNCVPVCKDGEKLNEKGECVPITIDKDALDKARQWLDKARVQSGLVSDSLSSIDSIKTGLKGNLESNQTLFPQLLSPQVNVRDLIDGCIEAQAKSREVETEIQSARSISEGHLNILKKGYSEATVASRNACEQANLASNSTDQQACKRAASRAETHAASARQAAKNAVSAAEKMRSLYASARTKSELRSFDELLRKIPAAIQALKSQITRAEEQYSSFDLGSIAEKQQQAERTAATANEAAQKIPDIVGIIHELLADVEPSLATEAQDIKSQADAIKNTAASQNLLVSQAVQEINAAAEQAKAFSAEVKSKISELTAMLENLGNCRGTDIGGNLNELRTNSDLGEIFGPAARGEAENATICSGGAAEICKALKSEGCQSDSECDPGYVCENRKCVSPFDSGYDDYANTMGQRADDRSQERADQVASDQGHSGGRSGFTSDDMAQDLAAAQDAVAGMCKKDSQCPHGFKCKDGRCVVKHDECQNNSDCSAGHECRNGKCVRVAGCFSDADCGKGQICRDGNCVDETPSQPATLAVSPANKAVVINETVDLKAIYTDTEGKTKDVTADASWNPSASFSKGEIGVYPVTTSYNGLSASAQITVVQEKGMDDITVNQKTITVTFWDHGKEDGDMIDILINGQVVFPGITLTNAHQSRTITMNADIIVVGFRALNEGSISPNTATVTFSSVTAGKEKQEYRLSENQSANMNVTYEP